MLSMVGLDNTYGSVALPTAKSADILLVYQTLWQPPPADDVKNRQMYGLSLVIISAKYILSMLSFEGGSRSFYKIYIMLSVHLKRISRDNPTTLKREHNKVNLLN